MASDGCMLLAGLPYEAFANVVGMLRPKTLRRVERSCRAAADLVAAVRQTEAETQPQLHWSVQPFRDTLLTDRHVVTYDFDLRVELCVPHGYAARSVFVYPCGQRDLTVDRVFEALDAAPTTDKYAEPMMFEPAVDAIDELLCTMRPRDAPVPACEVALWTRRVADVIGAQNIERLVVAGSPAVQWTTSLGCDDDLMTEARNWVCVSELVRDDMAAHGQADQPILFTFQREDRPDELMAVLELAFDDANHRLDAEFTWIEERPSPTRPFVRCFESSTSLMTGGIAPFVGVLSNEMQGAPLIVRCTSDAEDHCFTYSVRPPCNE